MKTDIVKRLRNKESIKLFDSSAKRFIRIQLNKSFKEICWERWVMAAGSTHANRWVQHNSCLSLKEVINIINENKLKNKKP